MEIGTQQETQWFVVVPKITEDIVLGLAWFDKWGPNIWWGMVVDTCN